MDETGFQMDIASIAKVIYDAETWASDAKAIQPGHHEWVMLDQATSVRAGACSLLSWLHSLLHSLHILAPRLSSRLDRSAGSDPVSTTPRCQ